METKIFERGTTNVSTFSVRAKADGFGKMLLTISGCPEIIIANRGTVDIEFNILSAGPQPVMCTITKES